MKKTIFLTAVLVLAVYCRAFAGTPAGILIYTQSGNETYILLADHAFRSQQKRGWGCFGGAAEQGESTAETAARETEEETRGYFKKELLLDKIKGAAPLMDEGFALYFVRVDFVPAVRIANNTELGSDISYSERGPYAWIPFSDIQKYLSNEIDRKKTYPIDPDFLPENTCSRHYWTALLLNLKRAMAENRLPWIPVK